MALVPGMVYLRRPAGGAGADSLAVNLFEQSEATVVLDGVPVNIRQSTGVPYRGGAALTFGMKQRARFGVMVRMPEWAAGLTTRDSAPGIRNESGWLEIAPREWKDGDVVRLDFGVGAHQVVGEFGNEGKAAVVWGPLIMAYDSSLNGGVPLAPCTALDSSGGATVRTLPAWSLWFPVLAGPGAQKMGATLVPFAEAGRDGGTFRIWLRTPGSGGGCSLMAEGRESRGVEGNVEGSIIDGDPSTFVVTWDGKRHDLDWFAVTVNAPVTFRRVVYAHGRTFHDGGWFDAGRGRPWVEIQRTDGEWEVLGELSEYPATTATEPVGLIGGEQFTLRLKDPVTALAVRVRGLGACGDNSAQCFASCGELGVYTD
jgi:hypothetical protein